MENVNVAETLRVLKVLAYFFEQLGIPGFVALLLCGPFATVIAVCILDFFRQRHVRQEEEARRAALRAMEDEHRQEVKGDMELIRDLMEQHRTQTTLLVEQHRTQTTALVEQHRGETAAILRSLNDKHAELAGFYKDNVELVKATQRLAGDLRDTVLNNTQTMERLNNAVHANFYCPVAREAATGKR